MDLLQNERHYIYDLLVNASLSPFDSKISENGVATLDLGHKDAVSYYDTIN